MTRKRKLVLVGNGMAGMRAIEELLKLAPEHVRHHGVRQRAARQLQPHPAVAGAGGRENRRRHHAEHARVVRRERHHAARRRRSRAHRSSAAARHRQERARGAVRPADSRDRLEPDRAAAAGQGAAGRRQLSRHRRRRSHDRRVARVQARRRHRRRAARPRGSVRPPEARHGRHRRASASDADGAAARCVGRRAA